MKRRETSSEIPTQSPTLTVPVGVRIHGLIDGFTNLTVCGEIFGRVQVEGAVRVRKGARVCGDVGGATIRVEGVVVGNIRSAAKVILSDEARVYGDIYAVRIELSESAEVHGEMSEFGVPTRSGPTSFPPKPLQVTKAPEAKSPVVLPKEGTQDAGSGEASRRAPRFALPRRARGRLRPRSSVRVQGRGVRDREEEPIA